MITCLRARKKRFARVKLCCCEWVAVNDIVEQLNVTQPTVSHHLAVLREAGLVDAREQGKQTFYHLNQKRITDCCSLLMVQFAPEDELTRQVIIKILE